MMRRAVVAALAIAALAPASALASGQGHPIAATAGQPFSGRVATAFYCDGCAPTAATIDWGDGTSSPGTLTDVGPPGASNYDVSGTHTWSAAGTYSVKVTVARPSPPGDEDIPTTATVAAGPPAPAPPAPAPPPAPLSAAFQPAAAGATPGMVQLVPAVGEGNGLTYSWDFDGDLGSDWACPESAPIASHSFATPGPKTVTLTVSDAMGRKSVSTETIAVPKARANRAAGKSGGVSTCERRAAEASARGCVKSFGFGIVEAMSTGRADDCFELSSRSVKPKFGMAAAAAQTTGEVYHATIRGPVRLNGLDLPLGRARSDYDSAKATIDLGRARVQVGDFPTVEIPIAKTIEPDAHGRFHLMSAKAPGSAKLGGLPVTGGVSIDLLRGRRSETTVNLGLPNVFTFAGGDRAQGAVTLLADNRNGWRLDGARLGPIDYVRMGPIEVRSLFFAFKQSEQLWEGGAEIGFFPGGPGIDATPPPPDQGFGIKDGRFDHAGASVLFPQPYPQLFPGIGVSRIGFAIGVHPLRFTGDVGLAVGQGIITIDGTLLAIFATPDEPYDMPSFGGIPGRRLETTMLSAGGEAKLNVPVVGHVKLADAHVVYEFPDYVEFGAGFKFDGDFEIGSFSIDGGVSGFVAASRRLLDLEGGIRACLDFKVVDACVDAGAVVSSKGAAVCAIVPVPWVPVGVPAGVGYVWGAATPDFMLFSCDRGPYREARPRGVRAAQAGAAAFELPAGLPAAAVRISGVGGAPSGTLAGPHGERFAIGAGAATAGGASFAAARYAESATTQFWLRRPAAGRWTFTAEAGSPAVRSIATANGLDPPRISGRVTGRGRHRILRYRLGRGQKVTFVERGARTARVLGVARRGAGTIAFSPGDGKRERRRIVALVERGGPPPRPVTVTRYSAPGPLRPARPVGLRVVRRGATLIARWRPLAGATRYGVTLRTAIGARRFVVTRARTVRFTVDPSLDATVEVAGLGRNGLLGRAAYAPSCATRSSSAASAFGSSTIGKCPPGISIGSTPSRSRAAARSVAGSNSSSSRAMTTAADIALRPRGWAPAAGAIGRNRAARRRASSGRRRG